MRKAFTMVELIFVIVILGILAAVAVPKMGNSKTQADISKGRADVSAIRSAILTERQSQLIKGVNKYIPELSNDSTLLFTGDDEGRILLTYGIASGTSEGKWSADDTEYKKYTFVANGQNVKFEYDSISGTFDCIAYNSDDALAICKKLVY